MVYHHCLEAYKILHIWVAPVDIAGFVLRIREQHKCQVWVSGGCICVVERTQCGETRVQIHKPLMFYFILADFFAPPMGGGWRGRRARD